MTLHVAGSEKLTIGVKAFDTFKIEIKPVEGGEGESTLWVNKDNRIIVKMENKLPAQMGWWSCDVELSQ